MNAQDELTSLEKQLAVIYKDLSDRYRKLTKVNDELRLSAVQGLIDREVMRTVEIRERMTALRKQIMEEWSSRNKGVKV
jgi:FixJ family two-component response regulator